MDAGNILRRVELLETRVQELEQLPARIDALTSQISQFRQETRDEFAAVRQEMADGLAAVRQVMAYGFAAVRQEMADGLAAVRQEMAEGLAAVRQEMAGQVLALRQEMRDGDEETRRYMHVLYEDLVERIKWIGEGLSLPPRPEPALPPGSVDPSPRPRRRRRR
jgi:hypothetical protein